MKRFYVAAALIAVLFLCSNIAASDKPKSPLGFWTYDAYTVQADTFYWSGINSLYTMCFSKIDSTTKRVSKHIMIGFKKRPLDSGDYKVMSTPKADDEVSVIARDRGAGYISRPGRQGTVHVTSKNGKLSIWANKIVVDVIPDGQRGRLCCDSTYFSFNLREF